MRGTRTFVLGYVDLPALCPSHSHFWRFLALFRIQVVYDVFPLEDLVEVKQIGIA